MSIIGQLGFGGLRIADDEIIVAAGTTPTYTTDTPNANTDRALNHASAIGTHSARHAWTAAKSEFWLHYHFKNPANNTSNDLHVLGYGKSGTLLGGVSFEDSTNNITIQVDGVVVATSATPIASATWESIHIHVIMASPSGTFDVYKNGNLVTPVLSFSGNTDPNTDVTADEFYWTMRQLSSRIANLIAMDPNDATGTVDANDFSNPQIAVFVPDADSVTYAEWAPDSGSVGFSRINERPSSDPDYVEATAVGERSTFSHEPASGIASVVTNVKWSGRMTRTGSDAGVNVILRRRHSATDYDESAVPAPGAGQVSKMWNEQGAGGAWTPTVLDATEFGVVSET